MGKCEHFGGAVIKPDGINILDPCVYEVTEVYRNVTVVVSKCPICGFVDISWERQPDTEQLEIERFD